LKHVCRCLNKNPYRDWVTGVQKKNRLNHKGLAKKKKNTCAARCRSKMGKCQSYGGLLGGRDVRGGTRRHQKNSSHDAQEKNANGQGLREETSSEGGKKQSTAMARKKKNTQQVV